MDRATAVLAGFALMLLTGRAPAQAPPAPTSPPEAATAPEPIPAAAEPADDVAEEPPPPAGPRPPPREAAPLAPRSDWFVGIDASVGPLPGLTPHLVGAALLARFGYHYDRERFFVSPEAALGLVEIAGDEKGAGFHSERVWIGAGARAGLRAGRFEPSLFSHAYIWFIGGGRAEDPGAGGRGYPAIDLGIALDIRLTGAVVIGPHLAVIFVPDHSDATFGIAGLHVELMR